MDIKTQWDGTARDLDRTKNRLAKARYDLAQKRATVSSDHTTRKKPTKKRKTAKRDPAWFEKKPAKRHAKAARAGWKAVAKEGWKPKSKKRRSTRKTVTKTSGTRSAKKSAATSTGPKRGPGGRFAKSSSDLSRRRDPAWFEPAPAERHSFAAEKGWRKVAKKGWVPKRVRPKEFVAVETDPVRGRGGRFTRSRRRDPAWFEEKPAINHALAARTGWKKVAKKGWRPKNPSPFVPVRDPEHYGSRGKGHSRGGMSYSRAIRETY